MRAWAGVLLIGVGVGVLALLGWLASLAVPILGSILVLFLQPLFGLGAGYAAARLTRASGNACLWRGLVAGSVAGVAATLGLIVLGAFAGVILTALIGAFMGTPPPYNAPWYATLQRDIASGGAWLGALVGLVSALLMAVGGVAGGAIQRNAH